MRADGPYRARLLAALADGEWHGERELRHPRMSRRGLDAFVRVLVSEGHRVEIDRSGAEPRYRLSRTLRP